MTPAIQKARLFMKLPIIGVCALVLLPALAQAQELSDQATAAIAVEASTPAPKTGMSNWAFGISLAGPMVNVVTQEVAFAKFGVYDKLVPRRVGMGALNLSIPFAVKWLMRKVPQEQANANGIVVGAWGFVDAGKNIHVMVTWGGR